MSDDEMREIYRLANEAEMRAESLRTGFGSNMSRGAIVAGLRAVAAEAWRQGMNDLALATLPNAPEPVNPYT